jgi:hypothetical protein
MWGLRQHILLGIVIGLCGVSGNTFYWVLLLGFMWDLGQHTLLGIVVCLCVASGNTLCWILLLVYMGPWATHFTGLDVGIQQWV